MSPAAVKSKKEAPIDFEAEIAELQVLFRVLGEEAIMMRKAGKLAEKEKSYFGDIVTEADHLIEREIIKRIQLRYPNHCVNGEESGQSRPAAAGHTCEYEWIVNPIDGTTNFSKGLKFFSISVGFLDHGVPVMGIIYFPELARFVHAIKGHGVFDNGKPFQRFERPETRDMKHALIAAATTRRKNGRQEILGALRMGSLNLVNSGCMTYNCIELAEGKIDAAINTDATLFNIAAAIPILNEMGCTVSGFDEAFPDLSKERIPFIATSNPALLKDIRANVKEVWERREK
jgi:myo-inositol-1(or 4)-monophosphatase